MKRYYLAVTPDKYELPLFVADSARELADQYHININLVLSSISKHLSGEKTGRKFIKVEVEED